MTLFSPFLIRISKSAERTARNTKSLMDHSQWTLSHTLTQKKFVSNTFQKFPIKTPLPAVSGRRSAAFWHAGVGGEEGQDGLNEDITGEISDIFG
jgi:hypothetical protein